MAEKSNKRESLDSGGVSPPGSITQKEATMAKSKPKIVEAKAEQVTPPVAANPEATPETQSIAKPTGSGLDRFKAKRSLTVAGVGPLLESLTVMKIADANDQVTLHPDDENYWSDPMCFVDVPVKGSKKGTLHLIDEELALTYLPKKRIQRFRLALASKPFDIFFLCKVPVLNLDNKYNEMALQGCNDAKGKWLMVVSRQEDGHDDYEIIPARSQAAFPTPKWPTQSLNELIETAFKGRMIQTDDHPGLLRLIGDKQKLG
jgi:hypothetical protein